MRFGFELLDFGLLPKALRGLRDWFVPTPKSSESFEGAGASSPSPLGQEVISLEGSHRIVKSDSVIVTWDGDEAEQTASHTVTDQTEAQKQLLDCERLVAARPMDGIDDTTSDPESDREPRANGGDGIFEWEPEDGLSYENFMAVVHPQDRTTLRHRQRRAIEEGIPVDLEYRIVRSDGEERVVQERGQAKLSENGSPARFSGTVLDVTEQRRRERTIERLREKYQAVLNAVPGAVLVADAETQEIMEANPAAASLFEIPRDELVGRRQTELHPSDEHETYRTLFDRFARRLGPRHTPLCPLEERSQLYVLTDSGERVPVEINASLVELDGKRFVVEVFRDLTQRRQVEEALQEREARLRGLANSIPGVVYQCYARQDGTFGHYFVSQHAEEVLGVSADPDGFHERVVDRLPPEYRERLSESIEEAIADVSPWCFETPFEKPSGERIWIRGLSTPEQREGEIVFNGVILDITDQKEAEQALEEERDRFATLFDSLPTPVIQGTVRSGEEETVTVTHINSAFEEVFGYEANQIQGEDLHELIVPSEQQQEAAEINREALEQETLQTEVRRLTADGVRSFHLQAAMREQADGPTETYAIYSDITEQKQVEKALRERERWIRSITENASGGIFRSTPDDGIEYANEAFLSLFGYESLEDLRGADLDELFASPQERERVAQIVEQEGELPGVEVELRRKDGSRFVGMVSGTVVGGTEDSPVYYDGVVTDITEDHHRRKRRQRQQTAVSELMGDEDVISGDFDAATRKISETTADVLGVDRVNIWLLDEDGDTLHCADRYDRAQRQHSTGEQLAAEHYPTYFEALKEQRVIAASNAQSDARTAEFTDTNLDQNDVGALLDATLRSEGEVIGVVCHQHVGGTREWTDDEIQFAGEIADIVHRALRNREQRERRRKIAFQQSLLKAQQEAVLDGVLVVDKNRNLVSCNDRFAEIWDVPESLLERGRDSTEVFARVTDQLSAPEEFRETVEDLHEHPTKERRDEIECADGRVLDQYSTPLIEADGTHYGRLWTFRDITGQKERERELENAMEQAEEASRLKTAMLANMSHEIRTPLTTIIGFSEMLKEELDGERAKFAGKAHKSGHRLMNTLDSVLQLSKLEAGVRDLDREPTHLSRIAREAAATFRADAEQKSIALETCVPEDPVQGHWNEGALTQITENLLENAVKFTPNGGHIDIRVRDEADAAILEVEDNGIGISEEFQSQMFRAFKQESEGLCREYEGTGLGLSIVKRLVDALKGEIWIDTEKEKGTCVTVRLPRAE